MGATDPELALKDLVVITGFSGAGKSTAMAAFEDAVTSALTTFRLS
jgi:hypothetical protein